ncbi:MAG: MlaD family protein [Flavobacteriales bacterium]|jgi:phospholipid/cholesterol/gamma-HCH transport system substrate-binding protein|nr:MlaD family protein [Flavobacteriales bacterium]
MGNKIKDPVKLGIFVLAGAALLLVALYLIGSKKNLFSSTVSAEVTFRQVGGLRTGSNVRYMGINVGTVDRISIVNDTAVLVRMQIRTDDARHILTTARASLGNDGLMGSRLVNLEPGDGPGTPLMEGTVLTTRSSLDTDVMLNTLGRTNQNLEVITDQVRILAIRLNTPGNAVDLLADTALAQDLAATMAELRIAAEHARGTTANLHILLGDVRAGKGPLGLLVADTATEARIHHVIKNLVGISDSVQAATNELRRYAEQLNAPGGLAHALVADTGMAGDLRRALTRLDTGTMLLNEDLRALQRNWFFRKYFKEKEKEEKKGK